MIMLIIYTNNIIYMKYREYKITPKLVNKEHKNKKENKKTKTIIHDKIIVKIEEGKFDIYL